MVSASVVVTGGSEVDVVAGGGGALVFPVPPVSAEVVVTSDVVVVEVVVALGAVVVVEEVADASPSSPPPQLVKMISPPMTSSAEKVVLSSLILNTKLPYILSECPTGICSVILWWTSLWDGEYRKGEHTTGICSVILRLSPQTPKLMQWGACICGCSPVAHNQAYPQAEECSGVHASAGIHELNFLTPVSSLMFILRCSS